MVGGERAAGSEFVRFGRTSEGQPKRQADLVIEPLGLPLEASREACGPQVDEFVVHQAERLQRCGGRRSLGSLDGRQRAIQRFEHRVAAGDDAHAVDRPAVEVRRIARNRFVALQRAGLADLEGPEAGSVQFAIQVSADGQHRVPHSLARQAAGRIPPQVSVRAVLGRGGAVVPRRLAVRSRQQDAPVQPLEAPVVADQFACQPVEQLGMARQSAVVTEVARVGDEARAEVVLPQSIGHDARKEGVSGIRDPLRERPPLFRIGSVCRQAEFRRQAADGSDAAGPDRRARLIDVSPGEHMGRLRRAHRGRMDQGRIGNRLQLGLQAFPLGLERFDLRSLGPGHGRAQLGRFGVARIGPVRRRDLSGRQGDVV